MKHNILNVDKVFSFAVSNNSGAAAKVILIPSFAPSEPNKVIKTGGVTAYDITGRLGTTGITAPGAGGANGNYPGIPVLGGTGAGAIVDILVIGGAVSAITIVNRGSGYTAGDALNVNAALIGNVVGFSFSAATVITTNTLTAVTGSPGSIEDFHTFIKENPTIAKQLKIVTNSAIQLAQTITITPKSAFKNLENKFISLALFTTEGARNDKMITIDQEITLDDKTEVSVIVPDATTTSFIFVLGDSLNTAQILNSKVAHPFLEVPAM